MSLRIRVDSRETTPLSEQWSRGASTAAQGLSRSSRMMTWKIDEVIRSLEERGVLASEMGPGRIRFVTHLDIDDVALDRAIQVLKQI